MERIVHDLTQGSDEWHRFRLEHHGASEAAAMLGLSKNTTRSELLRVKHSGIPKEFSDFVQTHILDYGHEVEALARPRVEELIGEELYPATYSYGKLSASSDGLNMAVTIGMEHKQWNAELAAAVERGELPEEHQPQCQQTMHVTGAEKIIFTVSDGTPDNFVHMEVFPDEAWVKRIVAGWKQFDEDLLNYKPPEFIPAAVATPSMALPALSIQVEGQISLIDNLAVFGDGLKTFIARIPEKPSTDQEFADCKAACKTLQEAQDKLDAAEAHALGQIASFDEMKRTKALYFNLARDTRLALEKLVTAREKSIKEEIVQKGKTAFADHIAALNKRLGKSYMPVIPSDFAGVIKSKRTITSLQDAVDTELARAKIAANEIADRIQINLTTLREEASDFKFLFADTETIVLKPNDDLATLVKLRISEHKAAEEKKAEEQREKIRQEELAKIEAANKAELERQAQAAAAATVTAPAVAAPAPAEALATTGTKPKIVATAKGPRPTAEQIISVVATHYNVPESKALEWLLDTDFHGAIPRRAQGVAA